MSAREFVELVVNCFERSYRHVLSPGYFPGIAQQNCFGFTRRVALINNVQNRADAARRADELVQRREIDAYVWVSDERERALREFGLSLDDLGRIAYYSDYAFVAIRQAQCPWMLCWDADVSLERPCSWIGQAIELIHSDPRILAANPLWGEADSAREWIEYTGKFALGYGFSDQVFLARVAELARPIYRCRALASLRYPTAHIAKTFEQRVDAYMRQFRRLRATSLEASYHHPARGEGAYAADGLIERLRRRRNRLALRFLRRSRSLNPCRRIYWDAPAPH